MNAELETLLQSAPQATREGVRRVLAAAEGPARLQAVRDLAIAQAGKLSALIVTLVQSGIPEAQRIALELVGRSRSPGATTRRYLEPLLDDPAIPISVRATGVTGLLRGVRDGAPAMRLLRRFIAGLDGVDELPAFDAVVAHVDRPIAAAKVRSDLLAAQPLTCQYCKGQVRRRDLAKHLWRRHGLLAQGETVRTPLQAVDALLAELAPLDALARVHHEILEHGLADAEAKRDRRATSLCCECFADVPRRETVIPPPAVVSPGRVYADGTVVATEPTPRRWRLVIPAIIAALVALLVPPGWGLLAAFVGIAASATLAWRVREVRLNPLDVEDRAIDLAWSRSKLPERFVERLAFASIGRGSPTSRTSAIVRLTESQPSPAIWQLATSDARTTRVDIVSRLAQFVGGQFGTEAADAALARADVVHPDSERLRMLVLARVFADGFTAADVMAVSRGFAALTQLVGDEADIIRAARLWTVAPRRPWSGCGRVTTAFDLARYPGLARQAFSMAPDLMLFQQLSSPGPRDDSAAVLMCARGIVFRDVLVTQPEEVRILRRGDGYELRFGSHRWAYQHEPQEIAGRLRKWSEFWLADYLPRGAGLTLGTPSPRYEQWKQSRARTCPNCGASVHRTE